MVDVLTASLADLDPEVSVAARCARGQDSLGMMVSEDFVPVAVMSAQGSVFDGQRVGMPALASCGFGGSEFAEVVDIIGAVLVAEPRDEVVAELCGGVESLAARFPLYPNLNRGNL